MLRRLLELFVNAEKIGFINALKIKFQKAQIVNHKSLKFPVYLRPDTSDTTIFRHIFIEEQYKINIDFTPNFIIDAGANIGLASVYFKNAYPNATIVAIEPETENFNNCLKNTEKYSNIHAKKCGLWYRNTFTKAIDKYNLGKWGIVIEECEDDGSDNITATITVNDIMKEFNVSRIDLFKIDIETAEKPLFATNYEKWLPITKVIVIELHDRLLEGCAKTFFEAINTSIKNYTYLQVGENTVIINNDI